MWRFGSLVWAGSASSVAVGGRSFGIWNENEHCPCAPSWSWNWMVTAPAWPESASVGVQRNVDESGDEPVEPDGGVRLEPEGMPMALTESTSPESRSLPVNV